MIRLSESSIKEAVKCINKFKPEAKIDPEYNFLYYNKDFCEYPLLIKQLKYATVYYSLFGDCYEHDNSIINIELDTDTLKTISKINEDVLNLSDSAENKFNISTNKRCIDFTKGKYKVDIDYLNIDVLERITIPKEEFIILMHTINFIAENESRPILKGINFNSNKVCALDGYRMCLRESNNFCLEGSYTIPGSILKITESLLTKDTSNISIEFNDKQVKIQVGHAKILCDLLSGTYINYNSLIPQDCYTELELDAVDFLKEINFILSDKEKKRIIAFNVTDKETTLTYKTATMNSNVKLNVYRKVGDDLQISFNPKYFKELLENYSDKAVLYFKRNVEPAIVKSKDFKGLDLILPVRLAK